MIISATGTDFRKCFYKKMGAFVIRVQVKVEIQITKWMATKNIVITFLITKPSRFIFEPFSRLTTEFYW